MKVVSEDSSCSMVWWGARAACAEVSTGQWEASKAKHAIWHPKYIEEYQPIIWLVLERALASP
jgi:hypothetical protein